MSHRHNVSHSSPIFTVQQDFMNLGFALRPPRGAAEDVDGLNVGISTKGFG